MLALFILIAVAILVYYYWPKTPPAVVEPRIEITGQFLPTLSGKLPQDTYKRILDSSPELVTALGGLVPSENQEKFKVDISTYISFDSESFPSSSSRYVLLIEVLLNAEAAN